MTGRSPLLVALALPVAATVAMAAFAALEMAGGSPLSRGRPQNIAEAAAMGSGAETLRRLEAGEDPTRIWVIRPELISAAVRYVTALEAAVWSRRVELLQLLDERGAIIGAERHRLACLAADLGTQDIVEYLSPGGVPECVNDEVTDAVTGRPFP